MNSADSGSNVDSMRLLRNGKVLPPSDVNYGNNVPNLQNVQMSNDNGEDQQSHSSSNDPTVGNSDDDLRTALSELMLQNKILLERLSHQQNSSTKSTNNSINSDTTINGHNNRNGYFVMPDFNNSLTEFSGREASEEAQLWINSVESVARLHGWPESFKMEIVRTKLVGPSRNWYIGRTFTSWSSFVDQFRNTFIGHTLDTVDRVRIMSNRVQVKNECVFEYFHHKARLCREIGLTFCEEKRQIVEGLYSRDLCNYLLARDHLSENELLSDLRAFESVNVARIARFRVGEYTKTSGDGGNQGKHNKSSQHPTTNHQPVIGETTKVQPLAKPSNPRKQRELSQVTCFSCRTVGHFADACPTRTCQKCNNLGHSERKCPDFRSSQQNNGVGENVSLLERSPQCIVPPYMINITIKYPNGVVSDVTALIDTGSPVSLLKSTIVNYVSGVVPPKSDLVGINQSKLSVVDQFSADILHTDLDTPININFHVVPNDTIKSDCLLGRNFLSHPRIILSVENGRFLINFKKKSDNISFEEILSINYNNEGNNDLDIDLNIESTLTENVKIKIKQIFKDSYLSTSSNIVNNDNNIHPEMIIQLKSDKQFYFRPRRLSFHEKECLQKILDNMLNKKIIRPSKSEYSSPIVLVKKKNGDYRLCVDYRELNKLIMKDRFPLPLIDDNIDLLKGKKYFTCLDLKDGFHHVNMAEDSIKYTSFITPLGQYEFLKMPFGLATGPSCFSRFIQDIFSEFIREKEVIVYFDDIMIATESIEEHLDLLTRVLCVMRNNQLEIRLDKSEFLKCQVVYLGYSVNQLGIRPNPKNICIVQNYPVPKNHKELQSFIGLASYFRRFVPDFAIIAKPLYHLLKKGIIFEFGEEQLRSFDSIKEKLGAQPLLAIYDPKATTELHCDASSYGYGAILLQKQTDDKFHPIFYYSHRTTDTESRYHSYELEMLAIVNAIKRFHVYLLGIHFKIVTDCNSVTLTLQRKDINPRIARWAMFLQNYSYVIEHRPGSRMQHVDALSRCKQVMVLEACTFNQTLAINQGTDPDIKTIFECLEKSEHPLFELRNGLVYRKSNERLLFYVPAGMCEQVIRSCHDEMCHVGESKTIELIKQVYWFPKLAERVKKYINSCLKCIIFSPKEGKGEGLLNLIDKGNKPFQTIHIDHFGPINQTKGRFKHILVIVDAFSKFLTLYPVRTVAAKEACSRLLQYFKYYSKPFKIISDRGSCFRSETFQEFCQMHEIKHIKTAVGSPSSNGQVERYNRGLPVMLSKLMHEHSNNWDEYLYKIQFAVNNTINRSIQNTPSKLLFGINQVGEQSDYVRLYLEAVNEINDVDDNLRNLAKSRSDAQGNIQMSQLHNKAYHDVTKKVATKYTVGDYVMVRNVDTTPGICKKLLPKFKGPYKISKILPHDRYVISDIEGHQVTRIPLNTIFAARDIKHWIKI